MPPPKIFPCGGSGQPPCPPEPTAQVNGPELYTLEDMQAYGAACYQCRQDHLQAEVGRLLELKAETDDLLASYRAALAQKESASNAADGDTPQG